MNVNKPNANQLPTEFESTGRICSTTTTKNVEKNEKMGVQKKSVAFNVKNKLKWVDFRGKIGASSE